MFGIVKKRIMYIDVRIPFDEEGQLVKAYHRALADGISEWVLFLDHDVFLCNPCWYEMCIEAIEDLRQDPQAACIGCVAGGSRLNKVIRVQKENYIPPNADIEHHIDVAKVKYYKYGNTLQRIHKHVPGFFLLLKREVAQEIGFVNQRKGINDIDYDFGKRLMEAGYHIYEMPGLYVYHRRGMRHLKKDFIIQDDES